MAKYGFVYALLNPAFQDLYKIGCTERSPQQRADEISRATGVPVEYCVAAYIECENPQRVEQDIHRRLEKYRVNSHREFFAAPPEVIASHMFYHPEAFTWADRTLGEQLLCGPHSLPNPYEEERSTT